METQNIMSSLRRLSSLALIKKLREEKNESTAGAIILVLKSRNVEIPSDVVLKDSKIQESAGEESPAKKLNDLMDQIYAKEDPKLNLAISEIFPVKEISELEDSEVIDLIKKIETLCKNFSKKKKSTENVSKISSKKEILDKEDGTSSQNKKQIILDLIAGGKTRKEIAKMKIVSSTYLSKFYVN